MYHDYAHGLDTSHHTQSVVEYGEPHVWQMVKALLDKHNAEINVVLEEFALSTHITNATYFNQLITYYPKHYKADLPITRSDLEAITPDHLLRNYSVILKEDLFLVYKLLREAIFIPFSNVKDASYPLLNGDGLTVIPNNQGQLEVVTHTHYTASEYLTPDIIDQLVENLFEHSAPVGVTKLLISPSLRPMMAHLMRSTLVPSLTANTDILGYYSSYRMNLEVSVRRWFPSNYLLLIDTGSRRCKPFIASYGLFKDGLCIGCDNELFPLRTRYLSRHLHIAAWMRHMAVCHYIGDSYYNIPDI